MADAFPEESVPGLRHQPVRTVRAEEKRSEAGAANVSFYDPREEPLPDDGSIGIITTFDCIHDMTIRSR